MHYLCRPCNRSFASRTGLSLHYSRSHSHPKPKTTHSTFRFHPRLNARPCNIYGDFLPAGSPPSVSEEALPDDWTPFNDRPSFEFAELMFKKVQMSGGNFDSLLQIWTAHNIINNGGQPIFESTEDMYATIDSIQHGDAPWETFTVRYGGPLTPDSPSWKRAEYHVHCRNTRTVAHNMLANKDFHNHFDYVPFQEYTAPDTTQFSNVMSGQWAYTQATRIASDPQTHGSMLVPVILGADKTTVSVATGQNDFHPVYMSLANPHNSVRRAHRDALLPVAFLSIPKANREEDDTAEFRTFRKQLYHASLAKIMMPLKPAMTIPEVARCPDGHFWRVIYELGPFIANYPEQVILAGIVQGWCPKCRATPEQLDKAGKPRSHAHTNFVNARFDDDTVWTAWGIDLNVQPFTVHFPRADIHELITPDLLHQLIKGTFKDHLVSWVEQYLQTVHSKAEAQRHMDDIDRRIAAVPAFPGLRRFPEGRNFKQWTGNDSKALMKVYLPAIEGHVPNDMVRCFAAYLDFCYLARRSSHDTQTLTAMQEALDRFHQFRVIFEQEELFGSPNGICSSITESKHIRAVKEPWRRSSKNNPLLQILRTNQRMLIGSVVADALGIVPEDLDNESFLSQAIQDEEDEVGDVDGDPSEVSYDVQVSKKPGKLDLPEFPELIQRFLYDQLYATDNISSADVHISECPTFSSRIAVYRSASSTFYAPSELSGGGGMHREMIRSNPFWRNEYARFDTVLISTDPSCAGMCGIAVVRVVGIFAFTYDDVHYPCALVEWFELESKQPDAVTGLWQRVVTLIHLDSIVRAVHLIGVYHATLIPTDFHFSYTLDVFDAFYVNKYADYHSHECIY
ncbi:hypothetical protein B0H21DRAFT_781092 [Amylocystis lapponica]|nr:hypothetical protein B0H21DRAFT_781092 [Amylocystis lapponica]